MNIGPLENTVLKPFNEVTPVFLLRMYQTYIDVIQDRPETGRKSLSSTKNVVWASLDNI